MTFAKSEVRIHGGVPTIFINDEPLHGATATSCAFDDPKVVEDFVRGGTEIMMIWIEVGIECWKGPGKYDWSYAENKLKFFEQHSGDTKWIIRVRLGLLGEWWRRQHPDEVHNPPGGANSYNERSVCNIASSVWNQEVCGMIREFTTWLKSTRWAPRIVGFMLNAGSTEEWLIFDTHETYQGKYQSAYTREFRRWLKTKYGTETALRKAWRIPAMTFDKAECPSGHVRGGSHIWGLYTMRDPVFDRPAIDYYYFLNQTLADHLIACCRAAKEAAGSPILCGGFHSYLWWETGIYSYIQEYGHGLIQRLEASPWVDFVSDITSYDDRFPGGPSGYLGLPHSLNVSGKLHYTEVDLTSCSALSADERAAWKKADTSKIRPGTAEPVLPDRKWKWTLNYCGRDEQEQVALLAREHMHNVITGTPFWWFDIRKHNYQEPPLVDAMKRCSDIGKQAMNWDRSTISEVAFVCSEDTPNYQSATNGSLIRMEMESAHGLLLDLCTRRWGLAGIPFDTYELHDLAKPTFPGEQYKLIIFVNCGFISPEAAAGIRRWQNNDRTMLWTFGAGVLNEEHFDPALNASLLGMKLGARIQRQNIHVCMTDKRSQLTKGGSKLNFGTEGSVGPVFFSKDPRAQVLGRLRDGGEPAFALRRHKDWNSLYLSMLNFPPALFRNIARFAGAHVWMGSDDVIYANRSMVCLHTSSKGTKMIRLPATAKVTDLWTGKTIAAKTQQIKVKADPYRTWVWRTEYV